MKMFKQLGGFIALLFGIAAIVMLFLEPALSQTVNLPFIGERTITGYTGIEAIFGAKEQVGDFTFETLKFSTVGLVALILLVAGSVLPLLPLGKFRNMLGAILLLVAGVLFFMIPQSHGNKLNPGTSLILAGVFSLVAFLINSLVVAVQLKK